MTEAPPFPRPGWRWQVLEGEPDHRDEYLTPDQQDAGEMMMICVSRCKGRKLVLDL